jgi:hypothetical protein
MKKTNLCPVLVLKMPVTFTMCHILTPDEPWPLDKKALKKHLVKDLLQHIVDMVDEDVLLSEMGQPRIDEIQDWSEEDVKDPM